MAKQGKQKEEKAYLNRVVLCKECDSNDIESIPDMIEDVHTGDMICRKCGVVAETIIDQRTEWRTFVNDTNDDDPSRVGGPMDILLGATLDVSIGRQDGGTGAAKELTRTQLMSQAMNNPDHNLKEGFTKIENYCARSNLPKTIATRAKAMFKKYEKSMRGKSADLIAASIYIACRLQGVPRTMKEICALTTVSKKDIGRCVKKLKAEMSESMGVIREQDFIARFCSSLGLDIPIQKAIIQLTLTAKDLGVVASKSPISVAAAAIYMISQLSATPKSQKEIAEVAGAAEVTIKNAYKDLYPHRHKLVPSDFQKVKPIDSLPQS